MKKNKPTNNESTGNASVVNKPKFVPLDPPQPGDESLRQTPLDDLFPEELGQTEFCRLSRRFAVEFAHLRPPYMTVTDAEQIFRSEMLRWLPRDYYEKSPATYPESYVCAGTFQIVRPIPREVMVQALRKAKLIA